MRLGVAALVYILLPRDWWPEFRFATPFFAPFYLWLLLLAERTKARLWPAMPLRAVPLRSALLIGALLASNVAFFAVRTRRFIAHKPVPFDIVAADFGTRFNAYASFLGMTSASILVPDVGGVLYYSNLRVYDLGGLTDKHIAQTLGRDSKSFYEYVFEDARPTFIATHESWTYAANLDADARFRRDYAPIGEWEDSWISQAHGLDMKSGDYVRREAIQNKPGAIDSLRKIYCPRPVSF